MPARAGIGFDQVRGAASQAPRRHGNGNKKGRRAPSRMRPDARGQAGGVVVSMSHTEPAFPRATCHDDPAKLVQPRRRVNAGRAAFELESRSGYTARPGIASRRSRDGVKQWAVSSAVEHYLDMVGVTGSIPVLPTTARHFGARHRHQYRYSRSASRIPVPRACRNLGPLPAVIAGFGVRLQSPCNLVRPGSRSARQRGQGPLLSGAYMRERHPLGGSRASLARSRTQNVVGLPWHETPSSEDAHGCLDVPVQPNDPGPGRVTGVALPVSMAMGGRLADAESSKCVTVHPDGWARGRAYPRGKRDQSGAYQARQDSAGRPCPRGRPISARSAGYWRSTSDSGSSAPVG